MLVGIMFVVFAMQKASAADIWFTPHFTNTTVVANSRQIIEAIQSGDAKSKARAKALVGSQVAYFGAAGYSGSGTNINIYQFISKGSNRVDDHLHIRLCVELQPSRNVKTPGAVSFVEVLAGTM
jgi:hypothetical protein